MNSLADTTVRVVVMLILLLLPLVVVRLTTSAGGNSLDCGFGLFPTSCAVVHQSPSVSLCMHHHGRRAVSLSVSRCDRDCFCVEKRGPKYT